MSSYMLGDYSFIRNGYFAGKENFELISEGRVKIVNAHFESPNVTITGQDIDIENAFFSGDVFLREGSQLRNCYIEGNLYPDKKSMGSYGNCMIKKKIIPEK